MKRITTIRLTLLTLLTLLFVPTYVKAQTAPASVTADGVDLLSTYLKGGSVTDTTYYFETTMPVLKATAADGQAVLVTQPADDNNGRGQVVVCNVNGEPLANSTYTIRFMRKYPVGQVIGSCDIHYHVGATPDVMTWNFAKPQESGSQNVTPFPAGAVLDYIDNFKDAQEPAQDIAGGVTVVAKTSFLDGGRAFLRVNATGVVDTLNFSVLPSDNIVPNKFSITLKGDAAFDVTDIAGKFTTGDGGVHYIYKDNLAKRIEKIEVEPADPTQSIIFLYQSIDSVAVRIEAESGKSTIYSFKYGSTLKNELGIKIDFDASKIDAEKTIFTSFSFANADDKKSVDVYLKSDIDLNQFPKVTYESKQVADNKQSVFVSNRPDLDQTIIYVKAENGDTISYKVNYKFDEAKQKSVRLTNIILDGKDLKDEKIFSPDIKSYDISFRPTTINYQKESSFSNVTVLDSDTGAVLIVTSFDGKETNKYYLHFATSAVAPEVNDIYYDKGGADELTLIGDPMTYTYPGLDNLKLFSADTKGDKYFVLQQGSEQESPNSDVIVRAFSGDETPVDNTAEIQANRSPSSDADLDTLFYFDGTEWQAIYGTDLDADPIEIEIDNFKSEIPPMSVVADRYATVTINYAKWSGEKSIIQVDAEDGVGNRTYQIAYKCKNSLSNNKNLVIKVNGEVKDITKQIKYNSGEPQNITWIREDNTQMLYVDHRDIGGQSTIRVTAEDGTTKNYQFSFSPTSGDAKNTLKSITINGDKVATTEVTSPSNNSQTITSGYTTDITDNLSIGFERNYNIQPIMITNYRNFPDWENKLQSSVVDLHQGGDKGEDEAQTYYIPITGADAIDPIADVDGDSYDVEIYIDGFKSGSSELLSARLNDAINTLAGENCEKYDLMEGGVLKTSNTFDVPYDYAGRWPAIEVRTTKRGQYVTIVPSTELGQRLYNIRVFSENNVSDAGGIEFLSPTGGKLFQFSFRPKGTSANLDLTSLTVNGLSVDKNGKDFTQIDASEENYFVDIDSVPFIYFEKAELGQRVRVTMTRDADNPWKYDAVIYVQSPDLKESKTFTMHLYQYNCNDGKLDDLQTLNNNTFDPALSDYATVKETKDLGEQWPKLNFTRSAINDAVTQTLTHQTADFSIACDGGTPSVYNVAYQSTNTALGAIFVNGVEQDLSEFDSDNRLTIPAAANAAIEVRVAEEGQTLDVKKTPSKDEYVITVTSQHGETEDYTLVFTAAESTETRLIDLTYDYGFEGGETFDPDKRGVYGAYAHKQQTPAQPQWKAPVVGDIFAKHYVGQSVVFNYGYDGGNITTEQPKLTFEVTAEDGKTKGDPYEIIVKDARSEYKLLDAIAFDGVEYAGFDKNTTDYLTPITVTKRPFVAVSLVDAFQTYEVLHDFENNQIKVEVKAPYYGSDNTTTYTFAIAPNANRENTDLKHLMINDEDRKDLGDGTIVVDGKVPDELRSPLLIRPELLYEGQIAKVTLDKENGKASVEVQSPSGETTATKQYTLVANSIINAAAAVIDGQSLTFVDNTYGYADISLAASSTPSITILPQNKWQTVSEITPNGANSYTFDVTAADGNNKQTYTLGFNTSSLDADASLQSFEINGVEHISDFVSSHYATIVDCNPLHIADMRATLNNKSQILKWEKTDNTDPNVFAEMKATVTAQSGDNQEYYVTFKNSDDADLKNITLDFDGTPKCLNCENPDYQPTPDKFSAAEISYQIQFEAHIETADLAGVNFVEKDDKCATVDVKAPVITDDKVTHQAVVTAANGDEKTYTVELIRDKCHINTLSDISFKFDGMDYHLHDGMSDGSYESFNTSWDGTHSFSIEFKKFVETLPKEDDIAFILECATHEKAEIIEVDESKLPLQVSYTIRATAQDGKWEDYSLVFYNYVEDVNTLNMIYVQPQAEVNGESCYSGDDLPLSTSHPFFNVYRNFTQNDYGDGGKPYIVTMHKDCMEEKCYSHRWPEIKPEEKQYTELGTIVESEPELSSDQTYWKRTYTIPITSIKTSTVHNYYVEVRDTICTANGLKEIMLRHSDEDPTMYLSKNDFTDGVYYKADKSFVSNKVNANGTEVMYEISMPEGWVSTDLPEITYDSLCHREKITKQWLYDTDGYDAIYEIQVQADNGNLMTYRLAFNYKKSKEATLCNIKNNNVSLDGFDKATYDYTVTLDACSELPEDEDLVAETCDTYATVDKTATISDKYTKVFTFTVQAQDETVTPVVYTVTYKVNKTVAADVQLIDIRINGLSFVAGALGVDQKTDASKTPKYFNADDYDGYKLYLLESETNYPNVVGIDKKGNNVTAESKDLNENEREYTITAPKDCEENEGKTYKLTIYKYQKDLSTIINPTELFVYGINYNKLKDITGVTTAPDEFSDKGESKVTFGKDFIYSRFYNSDTKKYDVKYPTTDTEDGSNNVHLTVEPTATQTISANSEQPTRTYTISAKAENESYTFSKNVLITMQPSEVNTLDQITIGKNSYTSSSDPALSTGIEYSINAHEAWPEVSTSPAVGLETGGEYRNIELKEDFTDSKRTYTYSVQSQRNLIWAGSEPNKYVVTITRKSCDMHELTQLLYDGKDLVADGFVKGEGDNWTATVNFDATNCSATGLKGDILNKFSGVELQCSEHAKLQSEKPQITEPTFDAITKTGKCTVTYVVVAQDGSMGTYVVTVNIKYNDAAFETSATNLRIDGFDYDSFVKSTIVYSFGPDNFAATTKNYEITFVTGHSAPHTPTLITDGCVNVAEPEQTGSIAEGKVKYVWTTKSGIGNNTDTYTLTLNYVKYIPSSDTQLKSVTIAGEDAPRDVLGQESIIIYIDAHKTLPTLTDAIANDTKAKVVYSLTSETGFQRDYTITVTAEDGTQKDYPLSIILKQCEKYYLTDIKIFGESLPDFKPDQQTTYNITRERGLSFPPTVADIEYTQECPLNNQKVDVNIVNTTTTSTITITSTSHDNDKLKITYTIIVTWTMNTDVAVLIYEGGQLLPGFLQTKTQYENYIYEDDFIGWPDVTADVKPDYASYKVNVVSQTTTQRVVNVVVYKDKLSEEVFNTYTITDNIRPCPNFYLSDLKLNGTGTTYDNVSLKDLAIFVDKLNPEINITLPKGGVLPTVADILPGVTLECPAHYGFTITQTSSTLVMATYHIKITKFDDPSMTFTYALNIYLTPSPEDYLLDDILAEGTPISSSRTDGYALSPVPAYPSMKFSATQYHYIINLGEHTDKAYPTISGVVKNPAKATAEVVETKSGNDSTRFYTVRVLDLDKVQRSADYVVEVNKTLCSETRLESISLDGKPVSIANGFDYDFSSDNVLTDIYTITLPDDKTFMEPEATLYCKQGHQTMSLKVDAADSHPNYRDYTFTVKAQNGATRTYTIREYIKNYNDAQLPEILVGDPQNGVNFQPLSTKNETYRSDYDYRPERTKYNVYVAPHKHYVLQVNMHDYQMVSSSVDPIKSSKGNDSIYVHTYVVTAKDGKTTLTYTVNVHVSCNYYLLSDVLVEGKSVMAGFGELYDNTFVQSINLAQGSNLPALSDIVATPLCSDGHQTVTISQPVATQFNGVFVIYTRSETGVSATYTLYYTVAKSSNADLEMISVLNKELTCVEPNCEVQVNISFDSKLQSYVVTLDYGVSITKDDIKAQLSDESASYVVTGAGKNFQVVVTAQDNTTKTYYLTINNRPSTEASVSDIIVNHESLRSLGFDPDNMDSWTYYVENKSDIWIMHPDSLQIDYIVTNSTMTGEEVLPRVKQNDSTFTAFVKVTAQNGVNYKEYKVIIINRVNLSNNALLADLKINGLTIVGFKPDSLYYEYEVECGNHVPFVQPQGAEPSLQTITKVDADTVTGRTLVTVTAQDKKTTNTYIIQFSSTCSKEPNHNALLASITISDGAVLKSEFDPLTFVYYAAYPEGTSVATVPEHLTYEKQDPKATAFVVEWAENAIDTTKIHVVAEDGLTQNDYYVIYTINGLGNPTLCDLGFIGDGSVAGFDNGTIEDFEPETTDYTINLENASVDYLMDEEKVQVLAEPCALTAKIDTIIRESVGPADMQVIVKVSDLGETMTYTVNVHIAPSSNGNLDNIIVNGDTLNGTDCDDLFRINKPFNSTDTDYRIAVDRSVSISEIDTWSFQYVLGNAQQQILSENNILLGDTAVIRFITVKAGDNTVVEYHLTFVQKDGSTQLNSLLYDGNEVPKWNPNTAEFEIYCSYGKRTSFDEAKVTYEVQNGFQIVDVNKLNDTTIVITVTADDCSQGEYTLRLVELDEYSALLKDLTVEGRTIVDFQPRAFYYDYFRHVDDILVPDSVVGIPFDSLAHVEYETVVSTSGTYLYITVTDRAGFDSNTYIVFFQYVPYDVDARAETWDVGVVHLGGDVYKVASHKNDVTFELYDERGYLVMSVSVPVIDPNQSVDDRTTQGREITIPADRVWLYTFYWQGKYRVERGKLMHLSR